MYPRVKRVRKGDRVYEYLQLVEGRREGKRVRQHVVATVGRLDKLKASGQLDRLAGSFARLDPPPTGTKREIGPLLLVRHYLARLRLIELVDARARMRGRALLTHGEVIAALVANRLSAPSPLYDVAGWASSHALAELFDIPASLLNDDRLGRALEALALVAKEVRAELLLSALERFTVADASRLHLDLTTVRFAGAYEDSSLVAKGWGSDRRVERQVRTLQAASAEGIALYWRPHQGATAEVTALAEALAELRELLPQAPLIVADSALGHLRHLAAAIRGGLSFVVPLRADTGWLEAFTRDVGGLDALAELNYTSERERRKPKNQRTRFKGTLRNFAFTDKASKEQLSLKIAYIWSSEEEKSVKEARERALAKAEATLERIRRGLGGRYYQTKEQVDAKVAKTISPELEEFLLVATKSENGKPTLTWRRDEQAITAAGRYDGLYALAANLLDADSSPVTALTVLRLYKAQWVVERRHRDAKQSLRVRPVFLHNDDRIYGLITVIGIALLVFGLAEADLRARLDEEGKLPGLLPEGRAAKPTGRNILSAFQGLGLTYTEKGPVLDRLTPVQRTILALLEIPLPWPEQTEEVERKWCGKRG